MKTVITIVHENTRDLTNAINLIQSEVTKGYTESSGVLPGIEPMIVSISAQPYPPGYPIPEPCKCCTDEEKEEVALEPTRYTFQTQE